MRQIQILHVIDSLKGGGSENRCIEVIGGLNSEEFGKHLISFNTGGQLESELAALDVRYQQISIGPMRTFRFWRGVVRLAAYMRRAQIDLVQTYGFYSNVPGALAAAMAGTPVLVASRRDMGEFLSPVRQFLDRLSWRAAKRLVVNARAIRSQLLRRGIHEEKIVVIPNGVDPVAYSYEQDARRRESATIGMIGNFRTQKDHETFIQAAAALHGKVSATRFVLVGSGPREKQIRDIVAQCGMTPYVQFAGARSGPDLRRIIESLSILVLCSHGNEGLPNVVLEAMAAGKPVVATDVGGTSEAVQDGITGFLLPPREPALVAEKLLWLIEHTDEARDMGLRGRRRVEDSFTLARMQGAYARLYAEILCGK